MGGLFLFVVVACESIGVDSTRQFRPATQLSDSIDEIEIPTSIPPSPRKPTIDNSGSWGADDFEADAELPAGAEFSRYVNHGVALWISPSRLETEVCMVDGFKVEKWPRMDPSVGCA